LTLFLSLSYGINTTLDDVYVPKACRVSKYLVCIAALLLINSADYLINFADSTSAFAPIILAMADL